VTYKALNLDGAQDAGYQNPNLDAPAVSPLDLGIPKL